MGLELIYTSAKKGLKPGSVGFCTVAMSRQMSPALAATLESLSGYRHLYTAGNGNYANNPVNFCHYLLADRGRVVRVLARISAAPTDYTGRTNKLAHFMVLDSAELPLAGPAWLLQRPGLMQEMWQGEPRWIENPAAIPNGDTTPAPCTVWQRVTGDAGWAGELLQRFCDKPDAPVHIICNPGTSTLALFAEALALLPAEMRWQIAFSTYFTGIPAAGVKCHWRGIIAGTATAAGTLDPKSVIDLTRPLGRAPDGPCNVAARDGTIIDLSVLRSSIINVEAPITLATPAALPGGKAGGGRPAETGLLELAPLAPERKATRFFRPHNVDQAVADRHAPRKRRWILPVIFGVAAFVILAMVGTAFLLRHLEPARQLQQAMVAVGISRHEKLVASSVPAEKKPVTLKKQATHAVNNTYSASKKSGNGKKTSGKTKPPATHPKNVSGGRPRSGKQTPATTNHAIIHRPLKVVDHPIFAGPAAGNLEMRALTTAHSVQVKHISSFIVRLPPPSHSGRIEMFVKSQGVVSKDPQKMSKPCILSRRRKVSLDYSVDWVPSSTSVAGVLMLDSQNIPLCSVSVSCERDTLTLKPARGLATAKLLYAEQMVADVRLKNGRRERIQFLPSGPANHTVALSRNITSNFPVEIPQRLSIADNKISADLHLKIEGASHPGAWKLAKGAYTRALKPINRHQELETLLRKVRAELTGEKASKPLTLRPLGPLTVELRTGMLTNNYQTLATRLNSWVKKCRKDENWVKKNLNNWQALTNHQKWELKKYQKHPKKNAMLIAPLVHQQNLHGDLAKLASEIRSRLGRMRQRMKQLESVQRTTFRVELYPGGPVLETVTYTRPGAATQPGTPRPITTQPVGKQHGPAAGF